MKSRAPSGVLLISVGRLDLDEAVGVVDLADRLDHPAAEHQPALHRLAPDVEVAVLEAQALVDRRVRLVDVERRRLRLGQDLDVGRLELDRAGRQLRVLRAGQAQRDGALDHHDELGADAAGLRVGVGRIGLVDDDLGDPVAVAQVEEDQLAVVAPAVDPAGQPGGRARVGRAELAAGVRAVGRGEARLGVGHGRRIVAADGLARSARHDRWRDRHVQAARPHRDRTGEPDARRARAARRAAPRWSTGHDVDVFIAGDAVAILRPETLDAGQRDRHGWLSRAHRSPGRGWRDALRLGHVEQGPRPRAGRRSAGLPVTMAPPDRLVELAFAADRVLVY